MAEQTQSTPSSGTGSSASTAVSRSGSAGGATSSSRGSTTISDSVVTKVAGIAAREVAGVHNLGGAGSRALGNVTQRVGISDARTQGVSVEVGERQAAIDLTIVVEYGESIPQITDHVRAQIIKRVEGITGLEVTEVNIDVDDLHFPGDEESEDSEPNRVA